MWFDSSKNKKSRDITFYYESKNLIECPHRLCSLLYFFKRNNCFETKGNEICIVIQINSKSKKVLNPHLTKKTLNERMYFHICQALTNLQCFLITHTCTLTHVFYFYLIEKSHTSLTHRLWRIFWPWGLIHTPSVPIWIL